MNTPQFAILVAASLLCAACSTTSTRNDASAQKTVASAPAEQRTARIVKSRDGSFSGELLGTPVADSKFAKLQIGMEMQETQDLMGRSPDRSHAYESGKRWIPFYFGNDARRVQAYYKGEGCLIFTGGNIWGGAGGDLIQIEFDASGACYQP
jgi:hypothetical protein